MSVIIRGIKMPEDCRDCPCESNSYNFKYSICMASGRVMPPIYGETDSKGRPEWCPLFEVKAWEEI